jgi:hypothetical protein
MTACIHCKLLYQNLQDLLYIGYLSIITLMFNTSGTAKKKSKTYPIGYFHIDIAEVRTEEGKLYTSC